MEKKCYILVGVSGSGKSTAVRQLTERSYVSFEDPRVSTFSLDAVRLAFYAEAFPDAGFQSERERYAAAFEHSNTDSKGFTQAVNEAWQAMLLHSTVLFVDNTNLSRKSRTRWIQEARAKGFEIWGVEMMTSIATVVERQKTRSDKAVPESTVRDMYMRQQSILLGSEVDFFTAISGESTV